ncbi:MAG TPA: DUF4012 domain-containing protein [Actinomycetota bacterium]
MALAIVASALIAVTVVSLIPVLGAVRHLQQGRSALTRAESALLDGDADAADRAFSDAAEEFTTASTSASNFLTAVPAAIPLLGRSYDAIRTVAEVGSAVTRAGSMIADRVAALPGGVSALGPQDGRLPLRAYAELWPSVHEARTVIDLATERAAGIATSFVPPQVSSAGDTLRHQLDRVRGLVVSADELLLRLPAFAGADGPRAYFLAAENPAELRGTGGLISSYSILTMDRGAIRLTPFHNINDLHDLRPSQARWPSPEVEAAYRSFDSATLWQNTNVTPDAPTAAALIERLWQRTKGTPLDGVLFVDVQALRYLLQPLGSARIPGVDPPLTHRNVVPFVTNRAYFSYPNDTARKDFLGIVGQEIFTRFLAEVNGTKALRAAVEATADGHIRLTSTDPEVEAAFRRAGVSGRLPSDGEGVFGVVVNNIGGNKLDYYLHVDVSYDLALHAGGGGTAETAVVLHNDAPRNPPPGTVFGPFEGKAIRQLGLVAGETYLQTFIYCGTGCTLEAATADGQPLPLQQFEENGLQLYSTSLRILPQESRTIRLRLELDRAWHDDGSGGTVSLTIPAQSLLNPLSADVAITVPGGTAVAWAGGGARVEGRTATWNSDPAPEASFELRIQGGWLGRLFAGI